MRRPAGSFLAGPVPIAMLAGIMVDRGEAEQPGRGRFMRSELEYSKNLLEGFFHGDHALIARDAQALNSLSQATARGSGSSKASPRKGLPWTC